MHPIVRVAIVAAPVVTAAIVGYEAKEKSSAHRTFQRPPLGLTMPTPTFSPPAWRDFPPLLSPTPWGSTGGRAYNLLHSGFPTATPTPNGLVPPP